MQRIQEIENECFPDPWTPEQLKEDCCLVAVDASEVCGYLMYRVIDRKEGEILNLAVGCARRRSGVARALLQAHLSEGGDRDWFLEVRESNEPARNLYSQFGFVEVGRRKRYYRQPTESAIVMRRPRVLTVE